MKKNYFYAAMAGFGLLAFSSCSSDDNSLVGPNPEELTGEQVIVLDMQDTDVLSTKSRPLFSTDSKGADMVTDVQLLVFGFKDESGYKFVKKLPAITNWNNSSDPYDYGRMKEIKLKGEDKLSGTDFSKYIILAVGQDELNENAIPAPFKIAFADGSTKLVKELTNDSWTKGTVWNVAAEPGKGFLTTSAIDFTAADGKDRAGEIFSGVSTPIEFKADGGFSTTVLLKRQVAGVLGYFNRIPSAVDAKNVTGVRLVSSNRNESLDLSISLKDQVDDQVHGKPGYKRTETVVNGFTNSLKNVPDAKFGKGVETDDNKNAYIVYEIDLTKWFKWTGNGWDQSCLLDETGENGTTLLGKAEGWVNGIDPSNSTVTVASGSVLAGEFVIPFKSNDNNTFELQLTTTTDQDAVEVLKTWVVKLDGTSQNPVLGDTELVYNIYRNHLYQVGKRGNGDGPTDPGNNEDKPQPLDKDQELIIKINDQWEFIHDMEIE